MHRASLSRTVNRLSIALLLSVSASNAAANDRTLLIVHAPDLTESAKEWAAYRTQRGWAVSLQAIKAPSDNTHDAIRASIRAAHATAAPKDAAAFAVMLLGDDDVIPAWRFEQTDPLIMDDDRQYVSDMPYQLADDADGVPDFPLGRVPARSNDDARALLRKIKANEALGNYADGAQRVTYVAGEGRFGPMDALIESLFVMMVDRFVPDAFDLSMTYAKSSSIYCPPPSKLKETVLERMREGSALFNYVGHGFEHGFDSLHWNKQRISILRSRDLGELSIPDGANATLRPVAFMSCCSVGRFDMPNGEQAFSESLLFNSGGPVAIISGSRITHPYANTVLQKDITHAMLIDRAPTAGMLDLLADQSLLRNDPDDREVDGLASLLARQMKWKPTLKELRIMHSRMYNLLGDPATELPLAEIGVSELKIVNGKLQGRVAGLKSGTASIRIETPRAVSAKADQLLPIDGENDPELEAKAAYNYPRANDLLLFETTVKFEGERFEAMLPQPLPTNAEVIRVRVEGVDAHDSKLRMIGALRLAK